MATLRTAVSPISPIDDSESKLLQTATECQQNYYEICSDWNLYENDQHDYLKDFIGYALFGPPQFNECLTMDDDEKNQDFKHFLYEDKQQNAINLIFEKVTKYGNNEPPNGVILCGIIYNIIYKKKPVTKASKNIDERNKVKDSKVTNWFRNLISKKKNRVTEALKNTDEKKEAEDIVKKNDESKADAEGSDAKEIEMEPQVYPVPVFKVRSYRIEEIVKKNNSEETETMTKKILKTYYIDNTGRVYNGFADYLGNNTLPKCTMVVPKDGRYQANPVFTSRAKFMSQSTYAAKTKVWIEVRESPASKIAAKVLTGGDVLTTIVTVGSIGVGLAAMVTPIGAGLAFGSVVGAGVSGLWATGRSVQQLTDRGLHGESIHVKNKDALGAWIGVVGGTMGCAATGGSLYLANAIRTGATVGKVASFVHDAVQIGNLIVNGVGISFQGYDIIATFVEGSGVSAKRTSLLIAHIFFFGNSVVNFRLAQTIVKSTQGQLLKDYESSLRSNRHRKEFQRIMRNTKATGKSDVSSNEEIIRAINKIDNKDQFFEAMVRNRKAFSASSAKASFSSDGKVTINGIMTIDPIEFASLPKNTRVDIVKGVSNVQPSNTPSVKLSDSAIGNNRLSYANFTSKSSTVLKEFCLQHSIAMMQSAPVIIADFANVLADLRNVENQAEIFFQLLSLGYKILQALPRDEVITVGDTLAYAVQFLWDYVKSNLNKIRPSMLIEDPSTQVLLDKCMAVLMPSIEAKLDVWAIAFIQWLKKQFPQSINGSFCSSSQVGINYK